MDPSDKPDFDATIDKEAWPLAVEALIGVMASRVGAGVDLVAVNEWVSAVLGESDPENAIKARTMEFAERIVNGPTPRAQSD